MSIVVELLIACGSERGREGSDVREAPYGRIPTLDGGTSGERPTGTTECSGYSCITLEPAEEQACPDGVKIVLKSTPRSGPRSLIRLAKIATPVDQPSNLCEKEVSWSPPPEEPVDTPPEYETNECPAGQVRLHIKDVWSKGVSPSLNQFDKRPLVVTMVEKNYTTKYAARQEVAGCDWYSTCIPANESALAFSVAADGCGSATLSGFFDMTKAGEGTSDIYMEYAGAATAVNADYQSGKVGPTAFNLTRDSAQVSGRCELGKPDSTIPDGYTKIHLRWPFGDISKTGFPGSACETMQAGLTSPPYPSSLAAEISGSTGTGGCQNNQAVLEFADNRCPWYEILVPNDKWGGKIAFKYGNLSDSKLYTPSLTLPTPRTANEYWLAYNGAPDNLPIQGTACNNFSTRPDAYYFYEQNPGPGYAGCGGDGTVKIDPCNPPVPEHYSTVHFRYLWAGQKTFTWFPAADFMPKWMILEVTADTAVQVICTREADRPWFNCPVPDSAFKAGATWRGVDKTHVTTGGEEWNTVKPRPFPAKPGEYWIRWNYGKPDIPCDEGKATYKLCDDWQFEVTDYYPDNIGGDLSKSGNWNDQACAAKPAPQSVSLGYGNWFPYKRTNYAYPFGSSLAKVYPEAGAMQDLLDAFTWDRYQKWKAMWVREGAAACGEGTARVHSEWPVGTVSEGQGYGMAISAAIGDKVLFDKLWRFARMQLSQKAGKYCGGLMSWGPWTEGSKCRPIDIPCDIDTEECPGSGDSAFDGDVDIGIGLVYAARQWPEYIEAATGWILKMECEINTVYDGKWNYPAPGDTWDKNCQFYEKGNPNSKSCIYSAGQDGTVNMSYYPPGYFRVFGDFLAAHLGTSDAASHRSFWYKTAETVYELYERSYDDTSTIPALVNDWGTYTAPTSKGADNYNWSRALWRLGVDAAWFGHRKDIPENKPGSSSHYAPKSRMQAKIDLIQDYYANFYIKNPLEPKANRFSTLCNAIRPDGSAADCDPAYDHNSYFVNTAMSTFVSIFDNDGKTTRDIRREAIEESIVATLYNDAYYQTSIGVYTMLFLSGNFPNPMDVK